MYTTIIKFNLPSILEEILNDLQKIGAIPILVGGSVRDHFLNIPVKDYDVEIFGIDCFETIEKCLQKYGSVKLVGKSFGVLTLSVDEYDFDFALPRSEKKVGNSHQDFEITTNAKLSFKEAALRRDFTINAIGYDFSQKEFLDPFDGINDLKNKTIKHINDKTFIEDSLRVYRAVGFASRFNFKLEEKTKELCKQIVLSNELEYLPKERIYEEFKKLFLKSSKPSIAFELMRELGILKYFPELEVLINCIQDKEYHPEGDVWIHTMMCIDEMARILKEENIENEYRKLYLFYAILCHDLGKPFCTQEINGKITSHKHESLGIEPTISFLSKLTNEKKFIEIVCSLVKNHLAPFQLYLAESSLKAIKRLSLKVNIEDLCLVCLADCLGRTILDKEKCPKATSWLLEKAKELNIENKAIEPLIQGRDLIALGFKPSKKFKEILEFAFDLQLDDNLEKEFIINKIKEKY
ncbi:multifunctional tRNA nucleotidyl transferase / 2'3'-cyclic phosphodiesterase / 2'nucleotidase / phosphatase [Arcobacter venerupis]|uniref:Multifunctional tRNA nucleotidyl transferase / 2'3'-cyclic phosphodiesterase / 2'nucleotidase / phosphatase n=1 Tax=Arcobacter venerupis TaxID=1054033 RepID=A0AAE7B6E1_9BACT|nr:HD domain-containing protein [Arcobacter venerupis]QKF66134.1 multifunctional tRNA nucleotidyl transferase / 2'3'-cyclic phosphodiesterase / 2'nucleotidase / phosphatase [Arcobacter venerupis]RWS51078.1 polynucleotide adenylyltransferase [Arcobacter venerupis]